jgi:hypothetical protein
MVCNAQKNHYGTKCSEGELMLRSGTCITDCGCYRPNKEKVDACVKNQLGPGQHYYYAEIPSDCFECKIGRILHEYDKKNKKSKGHRR